MENMVMTLQGWNRQNPDLGNSQVVFFFFNMFYMYSLFAKQHPHAKLSTKYKPLQTAVWATAAPSIPSPGGHSARLLLWDSRSVWSRVTGPHRPGRLGPAGPPGRIGRTGGGRAHPPRALGGGQRLTRPGRHRSQPPGRTHLSPRAAPSHREELFLKHSPVPLSGKSFLKHQPAGSHHKTPRPKQSPSRGLFTRHPLLPVSALPTDLWSQETGTPLRQARARAYMMYTFSACEKWKTSLVLGQTTLSSWRMESREL